MGPDIKNLYSPPKTMSDLEDFEDDLRQSSTVDETDKRAGFRNVAGQMVGAESASGRMCSPTGHRWDGTSPTSDHPGIAHPGAWSPSDGQRTLSRVAHNGHGQRAVATTGAQRGARKSKLTSRSLSQTVERPRVSFALEQPPMYIRGWRQSSGYGSDDVVPSTVEEWDKNVTRRKTKSRTEQLGSVEELSSLELIEERKRRLTDEIDRLSQEIASGKAEEQRGDSLQSTGHLELDLDDSGRVARESVGARTYDRTRSPLLSFAKETVETLPAPNREFDVVELNRFRSSRRTTEPPEQVLFSGSTRHLDPSDLVRQSITSRPGPVVSDACGQSHITPGFNDVYDVYSGSKQSFPVSAPDDMFVDPRLCPVNNVPALPGQNKPIPDNVKLSDLQHTTMQTVTPRHVPRRLPDLPQVAPLQTVESRQSYVVPSNDMSCVNKGFIEHEYGASDSQINFVPGTRLYVPSSRVNHASAAFASSTNTSRRLPDTVGREASSKQTSVIKSRRAQQVIDNVDVSNVHVVPRSTTVSASGQHKRIVSGKKFMSNQRYNRQTDSVDVSRGSNKNRVPYEQTSRGKASKPSRYSSIDSSETESDVQKPRRSHFDDSDDPGNDRGSRGRPNRRRRQRPHRWPSDSSESDDGYGRNRKHFIRPQKYSGSGSFETFYAHFVNCAHYNKWSKSDQLAHLKACLTGEAGQVLWDSGPEHTNSLSKLVELLTARFGATRQSDKHRMELKLRRRKSGETLTSLHQDIRRLMALAYPSVQVECRESLATDYFIDALADPDLALKVRERVPANIEALQVALRLETWIKESNRTQAADTLFQQQDAGRNKGRARGINDQGDTKNIERCVQQCVEKQVSALKNDLSGLLQAAPALVAAADRLAQLSPTVPSTSNPIVNSGPRPRTTGPPVTQGLVTQQANVAPAKGWQRNRPNNRPPPVCWSCREEGHLQFQCPRKEQSSNLSPNKSDSNALPVNAEPTQRGNVSSLPPVARGVPGLDQHSVYLKMKLNGRVVPCLIDSGAEITLAPKRLLRKLSAVMEPLSYQLSAANSTGISIIGRVVLPLYLQGYRVNTPALISPDIEEIMLGADWLQQHECVWDFCGQSLVVDGLRCQTTTRRAAMKCRRVFVQNDVLLPAKQQVNVLARSTITSLREAVHDGLLDSHRVSPGIYVGRSLLPATTKGLVVRIINTTNRQQHLSNDLCLGSLSPIVQDDVICSTSGNLLSHTELCSVKDFAVDEIARPRIPAVRLAMNNPEDTTDSEQEQSQSEPTAMEKLIANLPSELTEEQRQRTVTLLSDYEHVFSQNEFDVGQTHLVEHTIDTGTHRPIRQPLRRHPIAHLDVIDKHVEDMLQHGFVEPAASPWASNVVLVRKKNGQFRFCVDYRGVNSVTYQDSYPLPHIETCLNSLDGSSWFSTLDLRSGYHNIPIYEQDRDKTAFITRRGQWRYRVLPFGLTCAPSVFQRLMDLVLCGLSYETCMVYLDDIIVFSKDFDTHLSRLQEVFDRLHAANLKLHPDKCLLRRRVAFIGHVVSENGIEMQSDKIDAVKEWPIPRNIHEVRSFLGLCSYYRRFVAGFADLATPLHALTRKGARFEWGPACQQAFEILKERLTTAPILGTPRDQGTFILDTDASNTGLGAVLSQVQNDVEVVLAYGSRLLSRAEQNYCVTKRELLAVVFGLKLYKQYLLGRHFVLRTDHSALGWLRRTPEPLAQQARWLSFIESFSPFTIVHRPGVRHGNADALSRRTVPCRQCTHCDEHELLPRIATVTSGDVPNDDSQIYDNEQTVLKQSLGANNEREALSREQQNDPEIGAIVKLKTPARTTAATRCCVV